MKSFVVFSILEQSFGVDIESVKRILPAQPLTKIPEEGEHIEGMFQYEEKVIKVVSFRRVIGLNSYTQQLEAMFPMHKNQHKEWIDTLVCSVEENIPFSKTTDPHTCQLGQWIDSFHPENEEIVRLMKELSFHHQRLHHCAIDILAVREESKEQAQTLIKEDVRDIYTQTLSYLDKIQEKSEEIAVDLQRCLILRDKDEQLFGVNIDLVEDIVHIEEDLLHKVSKHQSMGEFMNVDAILEHNGKLVTIVKDISVEKTAS